MPPATRVYICVGAGGVGKTTIAASLAVALAARGERVAVVTIDPAPRLATALGLARLQSEPAPVDLKGLAASGSQARGELWAMQLDPKRTLDELVARLSGDERAVQEILANPIYRELSSAIAGAQELSAVAKLYELRREQEFDVLVLDTPPAENALDFLRAPRRLVGFLEGRALKVFLAPGGLAARLFGRSTSIAFAIFARVSGVDMLADLSRFFRSLAGVIDGFGERARDVAALLRDPHTSFVLVTTPEPQATRQVVLLAHELAAAHMRCGGVVFNRVHSERLEGRSVTQLRGELRAHVDEHLAARAAENLARFDVLAARDSEEIAAATAALGQAPAAVVPHFDEDVRALETLAGVGERVLELCTPAGAPGDGRGRSSALRAQARVSSSSSSPA